MKRALLAPGIIVLLACACSQPAPAPPAMAAKPDTATVRAGLDQLWTDLKAAEVAGDATQAAALWTETARADFQGAPPTVGRDALTKAFTDDFAANKYSDFVVNPEGTIVGDSMTAYQRGMYSETYTPKGKKAQTNYGRFVSVCVLGADGKWRAAYVMAFLDSTRAAK